MDLQGVIDQLRAWPPWIVYALLFLGAFIEYILPFLPGDMFVVAGSVLVGAFDWHALPVIGIVTAGAILGAWLDFHIGRWLVRTGRIARLGPRGAKAIDVIVQRMRRHGAVYLAVNRFIPALRAFFFVAAGIAGLRVGAVVFWSALSALAWNALLVAVGYSLGTNIGAIEAFFTQYALVAWGLIALVVVVLVVRWLVRRRRRAPDA